MKKLILAVFLLLGTLDLSAENGLIAESYNKNDCEGAMTTTRSNNLNSSVKANSSLRYTGYIYIPNNKNRIFLNISGGAIKSKWSRIIVDADPKVKYCKKNQPQNDGKSIVVSPGLHRIEAYCNAGITQATIQLCWATESGSALCEAKDIIESKYFFPHKFAILGFDTDFQTINKNSASNDKEVTINLSSKLNKDIEVKFTVVDDTAKNDKDFKITTNSITIKAGETTAKIPVKLINNIWDEKTKSKQFKIKLEQIPAPNDLTDEKGEKIGEIKTKSDAVIRVNSEITINIRKFSSQCALLPDTQFGTLELDESYLWRRIFNRKTMEGNKKIFGDKDLFNTNWNIQTDREFKIKSDDINNANVFNAKGHRVKIIKSDTTSDDAHSKGYSQGITNILPLDFNDKFFEIEFDYYAYDGKNGEMALILYDGKENIAVLSNGDSTGQFGYKSSSNKQKPFTTSPNGKFQDNGLGWLAIGFSLKESKITVLGNIQQPYYEGRFSKSNNHKEIISKSVSLQPNDEGFVGRFRVRIDNRKKGQSLLTILKQTINKKNGNIVGDSEEIFKDPVNLLVRDQRVVPETIKIAFSASFPAYSGVGGGKLLQEIGHITTCFDKSAKSTKFRVVEKQYENFYRSHKDKSYNGVKYDFNWLWNSPLRTKIAGSAPILPDYNLGLTELGRDENGNPIYDKAGYQYCVISNDGIARNVFVTFSKVDNQKMMNERLNKKTDKMITPPANFYDEYPLTWTENKKNLIEAQLVYPYKRSNEKDRKTQPDEKDRKTQSDEKILKLTTDEINNCFTLNKKFTSDNITTHMYFGVYEADENYKNKPNLDGRQNSDIFAIRPAGFGLNFQEGDFNESGDFVKKSSKIYPNLPTYIIESTTSDPLRGLDTDITIYADKIYAANIIPKIVNIKKNGKYSFSITNAYTSDYYNFFDTNKSNLIAQVDGKICADSNNSSLGKIKTNDENSSRFVFQGKKAQYDNAKFGVGESLEIEKKDNDKNNSKPKMQKIGDQVDLYVRHNNVMRFMIDANDTTWTQVDQQKNDFKKYGRECISDKNINEPTNPNFDRGLGDLQNEVVHCNVEFIFPRYIEFIPPKVAVNFSNIINQSKFDEQNANGGFTYLNDLTRSNLVSNQSAKDMSAKVQMIVYPTYKKGKIYSNFTSQCYANDINLTINYIGDRNFRYFGENKDKINLIEDEENLRQKIDDNFANKTEFNKYIAHKNIFTHNQSELTKDLDKIDVSKTHTGAIAFKFDKYYKDDINISNSKEEGYDEISKVFKRRQIALKNDENKTIYEKWTFKNDINVSFNIPKKFFDGNETKFSKNYDENFALQKTLSPGKTAILLGVNFDRNDTIRQNPILLFERDFMATRAMMKDKEQDLLNIYPAHKQENAGVFFYAYTGAPDAYGPATGFKHDISYLIYCQNNDKVRCKDIKFLQNKNKFPNTDDVFVNSDHRKESGEISQYKPKKGIAEKPKRDKIVIVNGKENISLKAKDEENLPKTDTIEIDVPEFLRYHPTFKATFQGYGGRWFGHGGVKNKNGYEQGEGRVLGKDQNGTFQAPLRQTRKIEW